MTTTIDPRSSTDLADVGDLRSVINAELTATPVNDETLRRAVWTYVLVEQRAGMAPATVIIALSDMVESSNVTPASVQHALTRRVIYWGVEAYFGHLGGDVRRDHSEPIAADSDLVAR